MPNWCGMRPSNLMRVSTLNDDEIRGREPFGEPSEDRSPHKC